MYAGSEYGLTYLGGFGASNDTRLDAAITVSASTSGSLSTQIICDADVASSAATDAGLTTAISLSGALAASGEVNAPHLIIPMVGSGVASSTADADLTTAITGVADLAVSATTNADLTTQILLDADVSTSGALDTADLQTAITAVASPVGDATATGDFSTAISLAATIQSGITAFPELTTAISLVGSGSVESEAVFDSVPRFVSLVVVNGITTADLTTAITPGAHLEVATTLTGAITTAIPMTGSLGASVDASLFNRNYPMVFATLDINEDVSLVVDINSGVEVTVRALS